MHWLKKDDADSKKTYEQMTQLRVVSDVWHKLSGQDKIDAAQVTTIYLVRSTSYSYSLPLSNIGA